MSKSKRPAEKRPDPPGPVVVNGVAVRGRPRERVFGGPTPDGPLPGRLLVLLSRLHRAEAARGSGAVAELRAGGAGTLAVAAPGPIISA